jgi:7-carboxy-7-deazaguanine synthase (Cx14CxxC type)
MLQARTMAYAIKEIFLTLQGEGMQAGRLAVFCRFAGCNLWSGREVDRATAVCNFCDTEFVGTDGSGGGRFADAEAVAARINDIWGDRGAQRFVVCTGGEPLLQLDPPLIEALHGLGFEIAVETNGTIAAPPGLDWICVSPKAGAPLVQTRGDELKLVVPQPALDRDALARLDFRYFLLQPMDGPDRDANARLAIALCHAEPPWRLSLQTHKMIGIP